MMTKDIAQAGDADRELGLEELDAVSAGAFVNPQPLPPHVVGIHPLNPQPLPP